MSTRRELLPVELLVRDDQRVDDHTRRVSVADHEKFRRDLAASPANKQVNELDDDIDVDPLIERVGRGRKKSEARKVLEILDQLGRSDG